MFSTASYVPELEEASLSLYHANISPNYNGYSVTSPESDYATGEEGECFDGSSIWNNEPGARSDVDKQAHANRSAAACGVPAVVWCGSLLPSHAKGAVFSCKVFLGGIPWDITENDLKLAFSAFGGIRLEWPTQNNQGETSGRNSKGYVYVIFDNERAVKFLLGCCVYDYNEGNHSFYFKVTSCRMRQKEVQVIPWQLANSTFLQNGCRVQTTTNTVFVGSLHGMMTAEGLAKVMQDLFGGVVAASIDTDKYKYPIGSGRVVFSNTSSYVKAISAAFVELRTQKFSKKIQIDPFLENSMCSICNTEQGPYFCRDGECFKYYCKTCWRWQHSMSRRLAAHSPMMRNPRYIDASSTATNSAAVFS